MNDRLKQKLASLKADPKRAAPQAVGVDRLKQQLTALRANPKRTALLAGGGLLVVLGLGMLWQNRSVETWLEVEPVELEVSPGASQSIAVSLMRKPRFLGRGSAAPSPGTIQLISFPRAVDVKPTTLVTTAASPRAELQVTGVRFGEEELVFAGSDRPTVERSWQTLSMRVVVVPGAGSPTARRR